MTDSYQATYDAVRSRIGSVNASDIMEAVRRAFDISFAAQILQQEIATTGYEQKRPSVLYRPAISIDGNKWCALYGANLQDGVAGFGDSPADAMADFDRAWSAKLRDPAASPGNRG